MQEDKNMLHNFMGYQRPSEIDENSFKVQQKTFSPPDAMPYEKQRINSDVLYLIDRIEKLETHRIHQLEENKLLSKRVDEIIECDFGEQLDGLSEKLDNLIDRIDRMVQNSGEYRNKNESMHKDHYTNNEQVKKEFQFIVQAQDSMADHHDRLKILEDFVGQNYKKDIEDYFKIVNGHSLRIRALENIKFDNRTIDENFTNISNFCRSIDKRINEIYGMLSRVQEVNMLQADQIKTLEDKQNPEKYNNTEIGVCFMFGLNKLKEGEKMQRPHWHHNSYIYLLDDRIKFNSFEDNTHTLNMNDLNAEDWIITKCSQQD